MIRLLPILLFVLNILPVHSHMEFRYNITLTCDSPTDIDWCYEVDLLEQEYVFDTFIATSHKKCVKAGIRTVFEELSGWTEDDGWIDYIIDFDSGKLEAIASIVHTCSSDGYGRKLVIELPKVVYENMRAFETSGDFNIYDKKERTWSFPNL